MSNKLITLLSITLLSLTAHCKTHPNLVITKSDVVNMQRSILEPGHYQTAFRSLKAEVDAQLLLPIKVPKPIDAGGGYTHEQHKFNGKIIYESGIIYQLTSEPKYAQFARNILLKYAEIYPSLPLHPKIKSENEGKLFWQGLNEAVWLTYVIQGYDLIYTELSFNEKSKIEQGVIRPAALFLSEQSPHIFNKIHNHGTWSTAAVGMAGYVLDEKDWVEKALFGLNKNGNGGFLKQLDELFSEDGYYNEGPYYQRYALMPFVIFAKAIHVNEPERNIFKYRNGIILKAINTTIQLSYNGLFFPLNDAIKSKGIETIELVNGVAIAYNLTKNPELLGNVPKVSTSIKYLQR